MALLGLFGILVLLLLIFLIDLLDLSVELTVFLLEQVKFGLLLRLVINILFERNIIIGLMHLVHHLFRHPTKSLFVVLDELLVSKHIRVIFQLPHQLLGRLLQVLRHLQDCTLRL